MKKAILLLIIMLLANPSFAQYQNKYPLQMTNQNAKVYSQSGSLQGYVKAVPTNSNSTYQNYKTYNKYGQRTGTYRTYNDGTVRVLNRAKY